MIFSIWGGKGKRRQGHLLRQREEGMVVSPRGVVKLWDQDRTETGNTNFHDRLCYVPM